VAANCARDAMPTGGDLIIQAENISGEAGNAVSISVSDTGEGMSDEVRARPRPFFSTKPAGAGAGLGLAQVQGFVTRCGGALSINTIPGQGAVVTITLPWVCSSYRCLSSRDRPRDRQGKRRSRRRVAQRARSLPAAHTRRR